MGHLLGKTDTPIGTNIGLIFGKTSRSYFSPFVTNTIVVSRFFSAMCEYTYVAPLYKRVGIKDKEEWVANFDAEQYRKLTQHLSVPATPIEVFDYAYGILHDPHYCSRFDEFLCRDFARVPVINCKEDEDNPNAFYVSEEMFRNYIMAGERLRKLHLMQIKIPTELVIEPNTSDSTEIGFIKYKDGVLHLNANKRILGITPEVWNYHIGGYQVLDKWFKLHEGEKMTIDSFIHIKNVVGLLTETIKVQEGLRALHGRKN
jgi:predicted helicase